MDHRGPVGVPRSPHGGSVRVLFRVSLGFPPELRQSFREERGGISSGRTNRVSQLLALARLPRKVRSAAPRGEYEENRVTDSEKEKEIGGSSQTAARG